MNELETRFRSWPLRHPCPRFKRRLVTAIRSQKDASEPDCPPFRLAWLAPATLALLVLCLLFNQRNNPFPPGPGSGSMVTAALSNQSGASWLPGSFANAQNTIPAEIFQWTNQRTLQMQ